MQVVHSVGHFSPSGKCDRIMNDMQSTYFCVRVHSIVCTRQKHKIADKIASEQSEPGLMQQIKKRKAAIEHRWVRLNTI
jgi:hypothetical protein